MHTMGKVGMGDFEKWGMILKWGGGLVPLYGP